MPWTRIYSDKTEFEKAVEFAKSSPYPAPAELLTEVYYDRNRK